MFRWEMLVTLTLFSKLLRLLKGVNFNKITLQVVNPLTLTRLALDAHASKLLCCVKELLRCAKEKLLCCNKEFTG